MSADREENGGMDCPLFSVSGQESANLHILMLGAGKNVVKGT